MLKVIKRLVPMPIKRALVREIAALKAPTMIWGYLDSSGVYQKRTRVSDTVYMTHKDRISIADNVFVWHYTILDGTGGLEIGEGTQVGAWVGIFTHSSHISIRLYGNHYQEIPETKKKGYKISPVKIGKYVFVGAGAKVLPGSEIGDGVLVSSGAFVSGKIENFQIVSGNPAKVIGDTRKLDARFLKDPQLAEWYHEWQES